MKTYRKQYYIPAPPSLVYRALTHPVTLQLWTGEPAIMSTEPGSEFSLWDGSIAGKNISFEEDKKIEQEWYFGDQTEPSVVTILLSPRGDGTSVDLTHTNIPDEDFGEFITGWDQNYFGLLKEFYRE